MPEMTSYEHGAPCWSDLATSDPARAREFYSALFGWEYEDIPAPGPAYSMAKLGNARVAGVYLQEPAEFEQSVPPHWNIFVRVDEVDPVAAAVGAAGGSVVMQPADVMDAGRIAVVRDPGGVLIGLWQPSSHFGSGLVNEPGSMTWHELMTPNTDAAANFYEKLFGWHSHIQDMGGFDYTIFHITHDNPAGGMVRLDESNGELSPRWLVYFAVSDCDATAELALSRGGRVIAPPTDIPPGRFALLGDPQGGVFAVIANREEDE
ncbi:MAG: VOC family protein [Chloroflexi bacterium]|nr:VOC family protein [Chloroflexota bacterium]